MKIKLLSMLVTMAVLFGPEAYAFAQQPTPGEFLEVLNEAQAKSQASEWAAAAPLWERVVAINPTVAGYWYLLGTAQRNAGDYRKAIPSLEKSLELGAGRLSTIALDIARSYAGLKDKEMTIKWIERSLELGFRLRENIRSEATFAFLRDDARFKTLSGDVDTKGMSRTEGWRYDLTFLETEIKRMHYRPFRKISQTQFESEFQRLRSETPDLTDNQIDVRIMRLMATIGDGHTGVFPDFISAWNGVPIQFNTFQEGMFITMADPKYADLVGTKVLRIGEQTPEQLIKAVGPLVSKDSEQGVTRSFGDFIRYPQLLNGLGLQSHSDKLVLTVRGADGKTRTAEVSVVGRDPDFSRIAGHPKWVTVFQNSTEPLPLYLKDRRTPYWFETLPGQPETLYFQFNLVVNSQTETLQQFLDRLFKFIDDRGIEKLIIDMRWNNGGNTLLMQPLINGLIQREKLNQTGKLFVIVGRYTYSAAINVAAALNANTNAILVGEPTPTGPNFIGESNIITLPYSKLRVSISDLYWQNTWTMDTRTWLAPLLYVPVTFEAYKTKRDPALETIIAYPPTEAGN
jgi:tetratricopeptide (TPR) repeat protein